MGFYQERVLPYLVHWSMRQDTFSAYRRRLVPAAQGRVLEVGVGSGLNLLLYGDAATGVIGLDPSRKLLLIGKDALQTATPRWIASIEGSAEAIPLKDKSIDSVVTTWTLCTIPDVRAALGEMRRVLRPSGQLLFVEHGRSPDEKVRRWQDRLTPFWKRVGGGCHLNRPIDELLKQSGFRIEQIETGYMKGPKPMTFMYEGKARLA
jgi:ubiquinone/menaquinone biosynthesis C-methylase UbiE